MSVGYSTIMYDIDETDRAISDIGACRYDGIEFSLPEIRACGPDEIRDRCARHDLEPYCVMGEWLESDEQVERVAAGASLVADAGVTRYGLLPPRRRLVGESTFERWLSDLCEACADADVTPLLHHHGATLVERPSEIRTWLDAGPSNLRLLFDTAHYYPYGDVRDGVDRFADDIGYVHFKDVRPPHGFEDHVEALTAANFNLDHVINYFRSFTDLGDGEIEFEDVRDRLRTVGYDGPITVEVENRHRKPLVHAKENYDFYHERVR
ncbi:sugar phosphate isomerase/epimerase [halophilic archaeon]|nr:sugar phosphate isomerase/epimerase [halophilic archaeon]